MSVHWLSYSLVQAGDFLWSPARRPSSITGMYECYTSPLARCLALSGPCKTFARPFTRIARCTRSVVFPNVAQDSCNFRLWYQVGFFMRSLHYYGAQAKDVMLLWQRLHLFTGSPTLPTSLVKESSLYQNSKFHYNALLQELSAVLTCHLSVHYLNQITMQDQCPHWSQPQWHTTSTTSTTTTPTTTPCRNGLTRCRSLS